jgi:predicted DNA-binding transcriptional regulator YafY
MATDQFWNRLRSLFTPQTQQRQPQPHRQVPVPTPQVQPQPVAPEQGPLSVSQKLNMIGEAARARRMLEITYEGVSRLVEPYSMRQGRNGALFYGWCNIHSKIHSFKPEKIEELKISEFPFSPRWPVEW